MDCLIIAAGMGSRLSCVGDCKPLVHVAGVPLIERVVRTAHSAGLESFTVVVGYNGNKLGDFLEDLSSRLQMKLQVIFNPDWEDGNGVSVLKADGRVGAEFFLLMSDHLFDVGILLAMQAIGLHQEKLLLGVDYRVGNNSLVDFDDVTKVLSEGSKICDIGKTLTEYNAFDTGIFLCSAGIFAAIRTSIDEHKDASLSGAVRVLTRTRGASVMDIGTRFWMDVDDPAALQRAEVFLQNRYAP